MGSGEEKIEETKYVGFFVNEYERACEVLRSLRRVHSGLRTPSLPFEFSRHATAATVLLVKRVDGQEGWNQSEGQASSVIKQSSLDYC